MKNGKNFPKSGISASGRVPHYGKPPWGDPNRKKKKKTFWGLITRKEEAPKKWTD